MPDSPDASNENASGGNGSSSSGNGSSGSGSNGGSSGSSGDQDKNGLEWTVFALGLAITLGVVGYMGYQVVAGSDEPADIQVTVKETTESEGFVVIPVEATNEGDRVAEAALIEVCAGPESCGELSFAYIPKGSKRSGTVGLKAPLEAPITTRVVSFRKP